MEAFWCLKCECNLFAQETQNNSHELITQSCIEINLELLVFVEAGKQINPRNTIGERTIIDILIVVKNKRGDWLTPSWQLAPLLRDF